MPLLKKIELASVLCAAGLKTSGWRMSDARQVLIYNVGQHSKLPDIFFRGDDISQFIRRNAFLIYAMSSSWNSCFKKGVSVSAQQYQDFMHMLLQNYQKGNVITGQGFFTQELKKYVDFKKRTAPDKLSELTRSFDTRIKELVDMVLDIDFGKDDIFSNESFVLSCAIKSNDYDAVHVLLKHGADCCLITAGCTVLYDTAVYADSQIMDELLKTIKEKNKLDLVNYQSFGISAPLKIAVRENNKESVILLLKAGALVDKSGCGSGGSALDECKDESLSSVLVEHQALQQKTKNDLKSITIKNAQWAVIV